MCSLSGLLERQELHIAGLSQAHRYDHAKQLYTEGEKNFYTQPGSLILDDIILSGGWKNGAEVGAARIERCEKCRIDIIRSQHMHSVYTESLSTNSDCRKHYHRKTKSKTSNAKERRCGNSNMQCDLRNTGMK